MQTLDSFQSPLFLKGDSHHLNRGLFYAVLLEEIYQAVIQTAEFFRGGPVFLIGFSLGGNFVLRILRKCASVRFTNLCHAMSISPVLNPDESTMAVEAYYERRPDD